MNNVIEEILSSAPDLGFELVRKNENYNGDVYLFNYSSGKDLLVHTDNDAYNVQLVCHPKDVLTIFKGNVSSVHELKVLMKQLGF